MYFVKKENNYHWLPNTNVYKQGIEHLPEEAAVFLLYFVNTILRSRDCKSNYKQ